MIIYIIIQKYIPQLERALYDEIKEDQIDLEGKHEVLASAWVLMLQLQVILRLANNKNGEDVIKLAEEHLEWAKIRVLPQIQESSLAKHVMNSLLMMSSNLVTLNLCDPDFAHLVITTADELIEEGKIIYFIIIWMSIKFECYLSISNKFFSLILPSLQLFFCYKTVNL